MIFDPAWLTAVFEYKWVILFYGGIISLVYLSRAHFDRQAPFVYLLRTKLGLKWMDKLGKRYGKLIRILGYIGIFIAYAGFIVISLGLFKMAYDLVLQKDGAMGATPVVPGFEVAGLGIRFPLITGWIALFIIMIVHEFSHGVVARAHNIKVKSSGIAFFGPLLGAFVEPDDEDMSKRKHRVQHSVFAAGPVSNVVLWLVCIALAAFVVAPLTMQAGVVKGIQTDIIPNESLPAYNAGMQDGVVITHINGQPTLNQSTFFAALDPIKPGEAVAFDTLSGEYTLTAAEHPNNSSRGYIGIRNFKRYFAPEDETLLNRTLLALLLWLDELLWWTGFISINIGLINLFPMYITDGAQMLRRNFEKLFPKQEKALKAWGMVNGLALFIILLLLLLPLYRNLVNTLFSLI